jgi:hypothetical protein
MRSRRSGRLSENRFWGRCSDLAVFVLMLLVSANPLFAGPLEEHDMERSAVRVRVNILENEIKELIHQKKKTDDQAELKQIIDSLASKHAAYVKAVNEFREIDLHVRFKHPDQYEEQQAAEQALAEASGRRYVNVQAKSLEELASEVGIDGRLERIKSKVVTTFPIAEKYKPTKGPPKIHPHFRKPASLEAPANTHGGAGPAGASDQGPGDEYKNIKLVK